MFYLLLFIEIGYILIRLEKLYTPAEREILANITEYVKKSIKPAHFFNMDIFQTNT